MLQLSRLFFIYIACALYGEYSSWNWAFQRPRRSPVAVAFSEGLGKPCASAKASAARGWRPMGVESTPISIKPLNSLLRSAKATRQRRRGLCRVRWFSTTFPLGCKGRKVENQWTLTFRSGLNGFKVLTFVHRAICFSIFFSHWKCLLPSHPRH